MQERVDVPEPPRTLAELREHERPAGDSLEVRATVPVNPPIEPMVTVELPVTPTVTVIGDIAVIEKSGVGMMIVTVAVWVRAPAVPVTFTRYEPGAMLTLAATVSLT